MKLDTAGPLADFEPTAADFRSAVIGGLSKLPRTIPCKFFYDARGSALFDRICELPEYYPTRTERGILACHGVAIAAFCGRDCLLIELGSGTSVKTRLLLDELATPAGYVPIDIARAQLHAAAVQISCEYPALEVLPVCADYAQAIRLPVPVVSPRRKVIFFPGSTIGNLEPVAAIAFLRQITTWCEPGDGLIIGVDFAKPREVVEPAYNDARGVTAAFNLNLLVRANEELGANFALQQFSHRAIYDARHGRIEMHLVSACEQAIEIGGARLVLEAGERVVTEYSYKYQPPDFARLAESAGWRFAKLWTDPRGWFGVFAFELARAH